MLFSKKGSLLNAVVICLVVISMLLGACACPDEPTPEPDASAVPPTEEGPQELSGTLRVHAPPWIFKKFPLEEVGEKFMADHPGVTIEWTRVDKWNIATYITEWKEGDSSVDVYIGGSGSMLGPAIAGDWMEPMDDMLTGHMAPDKFVGGFLGAGHYKKPDGSGTYYPVIPFVGEVAIVGVNTEIATNAGLMTDGVLDPVPSFEEDAFLDWFGKLSAESEAGGHVQIWDREFMQYDYCAPIIAMGGDCFTETGFDVTSDEAKQWMTLVQKMNDEGYGAWTVTDDEGYDKWKTNKAGSFLAAQGHIMELVNAVTEDESSITYMSWPGDGGSVIWTHSVWIPKVVDDNAKELGRAFISEQIFSQYYQQWSFNNYGKLPVMKDYYGDGIERFQDQMDTILGVADASQAVPLYADMEEYLDILVKYLPEAAFGRMDVDEAFQKIQEETKDLDYTDLRAP
jgi:ABC-type glycerol-3-phosphate transport system substrate-binding protein